MCCPAGRHGSCDVGELVGQRDRDEPERFLLHKLHILVSELLHLAHLVGERPVMLLSEFLAFRQISATA